MASVSIFDTTRFTSLAAGDVLPAVDISNTTQNAHGSLLSITVTNFFGTIPVPVIATSTTSPQLHLKYDASNHVAHAVSSAGIAKNTATGAGARFNLVIGTATVNAPAVSTLHVVPADGAIGDVTVDGFAAASRFRMRRAQGTSGTPTIITTTQTLGQVLFEGYDGADFYQTANITVASTENWVTGAARGADLIITWTPTGASSRTGQIICGASGTVTFGAGISVTGSVAIGGNLTITLASANSQAVLLTGYSITGANAQNMVDLAGTWNTSGAPTAVKVAITNTASDASSLLLNLLSGAAGATSRFSVRVDGAVTGGLYNGQTITSAAAFTGTVAAAGTITGQAASSTVGAFTQNVHGIGLNVNATVLTVANDATSALAASSGSFLLLIHEDVNLGFMGMFLLLATATTSKLVETSGAVAFTAIADNASTANVYATGGNWVVQNKTGSSNGYRYTLIKF